MSDAPLSKIVRSRPNSPMPLFIKTVGEALDAVLDLPEAQQAEAHWSQARKLLYEATDNPTPQNIQAATDAFEVALKKQKWAHI